jgi:hypothetical protein
MGTTAKLEHPVLRPFDDGALTSAVIKAVGNYDLAHDRAALQPLDHLSSRIEIDGLNAAPEGVFDAGGGRFQAAATLFVTLSYGDDPDPLASRESLAVYISGHFEGAVPRIDHVDINTAALAD